MKKIIGIAVLVISCGLLSAQEATHEYSIFAGGGVSSLRNNSAKGGSGGEFGIGYTFSPHLNRNSEIENRRHQWGIYTGVSLGFYGTELTVTDNARFVTEQLRDSEGDHFEMRTALTDYAETQRAIMLNIPVMGKFNYDQYFVMLGVKFGVPLKGKFSSSCAMLSNHAWYPDYNFTLTSQSFAGFGDFENYSSKGSHDFSVSVAFTIESGLKWNIGDNFLFYTGLFFDIGLTKISGTDNFHFITYDAGLPATFSTNSINSVLNEKARIMAAGIKLRLAFGK